MSRLVALPVLAVALWSCSGPPLPAEPARDPGSYLLWGPAPSAPSPSLRPLAVAAAPPTASAAAPEAAPAARMSPEERARRCGPPAARPRAAPRGEGAGDSDAVAGRIAPEIIQRPVRARFACMSACLADAQGRDPAIRGSVVVSFHIDIEGKVADARITQSEIDDAVFLGCILGEFRALAFPAPGRALIRVSYPVRFE